MLRQAVSTLIVPSRSERLFLTRVSVTPPGRLPLPQVPIRCGVSPGLLRQRPEVAVPQPGLPTTVPRQPPRVRRLQPERPRAPGPKAPDARLGKRQDRARRRTLPASELLAVAGHPRSGRRQPPGARVARADCQHPHSLRDARAAQRPIPPGRTRISVCASTATATASYRVSSAISCPSRSTPRQ